MGNNFKPVPLELREAQIREAYARQLAYLQRLQTEVPGVEFMGDEIIMPDTDAARAFIKREHGESATVTTRILPERPSMTARVFTNTSEETVYVGEHGEAMRYACDDYKKVAETLDSVILSTPAERLALDAAISVCERVAQSTAEIDPDEESAHCSRQQREFWKGVQPDHALRDLLLREREDARLQATLAAHAAYRELTDALAEFFYCGDPDDLKRVERAYEKTRGL